MTKNVKKTSIKNKIFQILLNVIPIILMVAFIPIFKKDYVLTLVYSIIITTAFVIKYEQNDFLVFIVGFISMIISEYFFISTGVETFARKSLFGVMPLWLPLLWAYGFVVIKRGIKIIDKR